jgi:hypothetical protein
MIEYDQGLDEEGEPEPWLMRDRHSVVADRPTPQVGWPEYDELCAGPTRSLV